MADILATHAATDVHFTKKHTKVSEVIMHGCCMCVYSILLQHDKLTGIGGREFSFILYRIMPAGRADEFQGCTDVNPVSRFDKFDKLADKTLLTLSTGQWSKECR
eukprot:scpid16799/ scgid30195/ 